MRENIEMSKSNNNKQNFEESILQSAAALSETYNQKYFDISKAVESADVAVRPFESLFTANSDAITAASPYAEISNLVTLKSPTDTIENALKAMTTTTNLGKPNLIESYNSAIKVQKGFDINNMFENGIPEITANLADISDYANEFSSNWTLALEKPNIAERSISAKDFAIVRSFPDYEKLDLPYGSKSVLSSLTKDTAIKLAQTEDILIDPKDRMFYHKDSPEQKLSANHMNMLESSMDLFASISLDELVSFESQLYEDVTFAMDHPVGKKIFAIIKNWNKFISFDVGTYYHAREIEDGKAPFLDQEMLKAPVNISSHGRYNAIGKSCYYIAETKDGALKEVAKHSRKKEISIQVAGLKPIKSARIIDLSGEIKGTNQFIEHMRYMVDNDEGKIVKNYLLPNFVASCCKKIGIEGIKYKSGVYNCCVLWQDDYFKFMEGSREIIKVIVG